MKEAILFPPDNFFVKVPTDESSKKFFAELKEKGYRYYLQITAVGVYGNAIGYGMVTVGATPMARLVDLQQNKVVWSQRVVHQEVYQLGGELKKLEVDSMQKTKDGLVAGINKIDFLALWGIPNLN